MPIRRGRLATVAALALAVAATAAAFGPIRSQINQAPTPTVRDLPAVHPVHLRIDPDGTPIIRD